MNSHNIGPTYVYIGAPSICLCCARAGKAEHAPNASKSESTDKGAKSTLTPSAKRRNGGAHARTYP